MSDYATLLTDVPSWIENSTDELLAALPQLAANAQLRMNREIQHPALETVAAASLTAGSQVLPRPADLFALRALTIQASNMWQPVLQKQLEVLMVMYPSLSFQSTPRFYAVFDATTYYLFAIPDQAYPYRLQYRKQLALLTEALPTNWFTINAYDALLAATIVEAARFVLDDRQQSLIAIWEPRYQAAVQAINAIARADATNDYPIPFSAAPPQGGTGQQG